MNGIGSNPAVASLSYAQKMKPEEVAEIRKGTMEEVQVAQNPLKSAEQEKGLGQTIDIKA